MTARHQWTDGRGGRWAVCGDVSLAQAKDVARRVRDGSFLHAPQVPWALCSVSARGRVTATCSPMLHGGLFWQTDGERLSLATDPGRVLADRLSVHTLDRGFIIAHLAMSAPSSGTPFEHVARLEPGLALVVDAAKVEVTQWSGPQAWPTAFRQGAGVDREYLKVFDAAVDECVPDRGPLVLLLSGGLDSTFLAASLVRHARAERPVVGLVHRPVSSAVLRQERGVQNDEWIFARHVAQAYPGRIVTHPLRNDAGLSALDVASEQARLAWLPLLNPANSVWTTMAFERATAMGAGRVFTGATGNFSFSNPHRYALAHFLRHGQLDSARSVVREMARRHGWRRALRHAAALLSSPLRRDDGTRDYLDLMCMRPEVVGRTRPAVNRQAYLRALADLGTSNSGAANPARGVLTLDPFEAPALLRFAAEMTPTEWRKVPGPRGYARMLGMGRVPDTVRLRTTRGAQSADRWWTARQHREQYLDIASALDGVPVIGDVIDVAALVRRMCAWDWADDVGPEQMELVAVERLLHTAMYLRWAQGELDRLNRSTGPVHYPGNRTWGARDGRAERATLAADPPT